jgi:hypothetical protein
MRKFFTFLFLGAMPAAALAATTISVPPPMTIKIGATYVSRVSVSSTRKTVGLVASTCYSTNAAPTDILYVENPSNRVGSNGSSFTLDARPRNVGTCTMTFGDGANEGTVRITVAK